MLLRENLKSKAALGASIALIVALVFLLPETIHAQCSMCKTALSGAKMARSLNLGILVLVIPPVTIFCSIFVVALKHHHKASRLEEEERDEDTGGKDVGLKF